MREGFQLLPPVLPLLRGLGPSHLSLSLTGPRTLSPAAVAKALRFPREQWRDSPTPDMFMHIVQNELTQVRFAGFISHSVLSRSPRLSLLCFSPAHPPPPPPLSSFLDPRRRNCGSCCGSPPR